MAARIYLIENKINGKKQLISASSSNQAIRYVSKMNFNVKVPNTIEVAKLVGSGTKVEDADALLAHHDL